MPGALGGILARQGKSTQIRYDQRIHACILELFQVGRQCGDLFVAGHGIDGHVDLYIMVVGVAHCQGQLLRREVTRKGTHTEGCASQVHRICAIGHCHLQPFHIAGWT